MRVDELYKQVAQLGFEDSLEEDSRFYYAANRALLQVNLLRPAVSSCAINHQPLKNIIGKSTFASMQVTEPISFEATDIKSYYFEADGNGELVIEQNNGAEWQPIGLVDIIAGKGFKAYKGFIKADGAFTKAPVRMTFKGEYIYSIRNVAMYRYITSADVKDIPAHEPYTAYDINEIVDDFLTLDSPPIRDEAEREVLNGDYAIEGRQKVLFPYDKSGCFKIMYQRKPKPIEETASGADDKSIIDLDEDLCSLLPTLIAAYVWADDEPEKAEYYLALYRERAAYIQQSEIARTPVSINNIYG